MSLPLEALLEGKYEILDKIAEGGIGSIYKVRHLLLEEVRVIKVLRSQVADREDLHQRLLQEAKTAIRLEHPSIAQLFDLTVADDGTAYIVMEFIDGVSLDSLLAANGPPSVDLTLEVAKQSLDALGYLHGCGFIHRDISPDNLMLTRDFTDRVHVKLIDLGIAKDLAQETGVTAVGTFLGKVKYCAPELFKDAGVKQLDQRSDNYSLAVTLYELLTGRHPFTGETFEELAAGHLFHPPTGFDETDPDGRVPEALREIILTALAKNPDERPESAGAFAEALDQFEIDEEGLAEEFERTVGATTRFMSKFERYSSGSTQAHLNEQFGLEQTGVEDRKEAGSTIAEESPVAAEESAVDEKSEKTEAVLTVVPSDEEQAEKLASSGAKPQSRAKLWAAVVALPLVAGAAWWTLRPTASPTEAAGSTLETAVPLMTVERFDPDTISSAIDAPDMPSELLDEEGGDATAEAPVDQVAVKKGSPTEPKGNQPSDAKGTSPANTSGPETTAPEANRETLLLKAGPGVVEPKPLTVLEPPYPRPDKKEVVILISAFISHEGKVLTAVVKNGPSFKRRYREAAVAAVEHASFEPATLNGVPGKMWLDVEVVFKP